MRLDMTEANNDSSSKPQDALPWLDRVLQLRYSLLIGSIVLAADVARAPLRALGLPPLDWTITGTTVPLGSLLAFVCFYLFFMSGISPMVQFLVEWVLSILFEVLPDRPVTSNWANQSMSEDQSRHGYVRLSDARKAALKERDDFWIARINEYEARLRSKEREARFMASVSFSCLLLLVLEYSIGDGTAWTHAAGRWLMDLDGTWGKGVVAILAILCSALIAFPWWSEFRDPIRWRNRSAWLEHPELAKQHRSKDP